MTESKVVNRWIQQVVEQDRLEVARQFLIRLLEGKFPGQVTPEVIGTINAQPSRPMLVDWFDQATQAATLADFARTLRA
jgi:hypothetical protein